MTPDGAALSTTTKELLSEQIRSAPASANTHQDLSPPATDESGLDRAHAAQADPPAANEILYTKKFYDEFHPVELFERYRPGGFHPTHIGDHFSNGRYRVVHKLGYGSYSTVWLAVDQLKNKHVALKIVAANEDCSKEAEIHYSLSANGQTHPGKCFVSCLLDAFKFNGPNGRHQCFVFEVAGCSVQESRDLADNCKFPMQIARAIAAQALLAVSYIHSCGIVHGDLHGRNILLQSSPVANIADTHDVYERIGPPRKQSIHRVDGDSAQPTAPYYVVESWKSCTASHGITDPHIQVCDFGGGFFAKEQPQILCAPIIQRPPEGFFGDQKEAGMPSDIWTLGCTIFEILGNGTLFDSWMPEKNDVLLEMVVTFGPLPQRWVDEWDKGQEWLLEDGSLRADKTKSGKEMPEYDVESFVERLCDNGRGIGTENSEIGPEEAASLEQLLRAMLRYEPSERITAEQAAHSEWMQLWGLPAIKDLHRLSNSQPD